MSVFDEWLRRAGLPAASAARAVLPEQSDRLTEPSPSLVPPNLANRVEQAFARPRLPVSWELPGRDDDPNP